MRIRRKRLYERQISLIDNLSLFGLSLEEIAYFLNLREDNLLALMEKECIDIHHSVPTVSKKELIDKMIPDFIKRFSLEEGLSDIDISKLLNISVQQVYYYKTYFTDI